MVSAQRLSLLPPCLSEGRWLRRVSLSRIWYILEHDTSQPCTAHLVCSVPIPRDPVRAHGCVKIGIGHSRVCPSRPHYSPMAWMLWCWKSEPTMLSHSIVDGMFSDCSSYAVSLRQVGTMSFSTKASLMQLRLTASPDGTAWIA